MASTPSTFPEAIEGQRDGGIEVRAGASAPGRVDDAHGREPHGQAHHHPPEERARHGAADRKRRVLDQRGEQARGHKVFTDEGDPSAVAGLVIERLGGVAVVQCDGDRKCKLGVDAGEGWMLDIANAGPAGLAGYLKRVEAFPGRAYGHGCVAEVFNSDRHPYFGMGDPWAARDLWRLARPTTSRNSRPSSTCRPGRRPRRRCESCRGCPWLR